MAEQALANLEAAGIARPRDAAGQVQKIPSLEDSGYFSAAAVRGWRLWASTRTSPPERQKHHAKRSSDAAGGAGAGKATAQEQMRAKLRTEGGRAVYGLRKGVVEPVFGQIKGARGFRRFCLRGLEKIKGEWRLVCLTHNLLKIWRYRCVPGVN